MEPGYGLQKTVQPARIEMSAEPLWHAGSAFCAPGRLNTLWPSDLFVGLQPAFRWGAALDREPVGMKTRSDMSQGIRRSVPS
jgi:hypothetical protein